MTRTDFKLRLPGYIATGLLILVTPELEVRDERDADRC